MKVNVNGRGVIPGVGVLAPQRGIDLTQQQVRRILNYRQFTVSVAETGKLITKTNIATVFDTDPIEKFKKEYEEKTTKVAPAVKVVVEKPVEEKKEEVVKEEYVAPVIEIIDDSFTVEKPVEERHAQIIGNNPDMEFEYEDEVETNAEESNDDDDDVADRPNKKKKKRNRH